MKKLFAIILALALLLPGVALAECKTASVTSDEVAGTYSAALNVVPGQVDVSISGTWTGTVTVERKLASDAAWLTVDTFTSNFQGYYTGATGQQLRIGAANGDWGSGTMTLKICQDRP